MFAMSDPETYFAWKTKALLADCVRDLDLNITNISIDIVDIIATTATEKKHNEVLERLYFAGLLKGVLS